MLLDDGNQTGAGAWTLMFRNTKGDEIQVGIYFPEDLCLIAGSKDGKFTQKMYTRDGEISKKWLEEEPDKFWNSLVRQNEGKAMKSEQASSGQPATRPESNPQGSQKLQPESEGRSQ